MKKSVIRLIGMVFFILMGATAIAQQKLPVDSLLEDFNQLHDWLLGTHPKLYFHSDSVKTEANWKNARKKLKEPMTVDEFDRLLSPLLAQYRDGHTFMDLDLQSDVFLNFQKNDGRLFPFEVRIVEDQLLLTNNLYTDSLPRGVLIKSINHIPVRRILDQLIQSYSGDHPENIKATVSRLFPFLLWKAYQWNGEFRIETDQPVMTQSVKGIPAKTWIQKMFGGSPWSLTLYKEQHLAIVECRTYSGKAERVKAILDSFFTIIRNENIQHVALDLRRNGGGNSYLGDIFLSYVTTKPFSAIRSKSIRDSKFLQSQPEAEWQRKARKEWKREGEYLTQEFTAQPGPVLSDSSLRFTGDFYLLTSARTFSSAHMTALEVKCSQLGTIIGQPTGEDIDLTGEIVSFQLPHSKLIALAPCASYQAAQNLPHRMGVEPDILVPLSLHNLQKSDDPERDLLLKVVAGK